MSELAALLGDAPPADIKAATDEGGRKLLLFDISGDRHDD